MCSEVTTQCTLLAVTFVLASLFLHQWKLNPFYSTSMSFSSFLGDCVWKLILGIFSGILWSLTTLIASLIYWKRVSWLSFHSSSAWSWLLCQWHHISITAGSHVWKVVCCKVATLKHSGSISTGTLAVCGMVEDLIVWPLTMIIDKRVPVKGCNRNFHRLVILNAI